MIAYSAGTCLLPGVKVLAACVNSLLVHTP
jgi:hypothetical protein